MKPSLAQARDDINNELISKAWFSQNNPSSNYAPTAASVDLGSTVTESNPQLQTTALYEETWGEAPETSDLYGHSMQMPETEPEPEPAPELEPAPEPEPEM